MTTGFALQDPFGLTGTVLEGQYRVDRVIGEGGFGVVYHGQHLSLDQPVAIKVLKGLDGGDARINGIVLEKFRAEARLLYTLSQTSLNIVRAIHFSATNTPSGAWAPFMVLEWLEGRSLAEDLTQRERDRRGGRSLQESLPILGGVADGLAVAHRQQVAHRDIKPANVFLLNQEPGEGTPRVKLLDFGIAKIMKDGELAGTKGTLASFTWLYAAPEQLDQRLGLTGLTTDVYAFGLMITEVLTGRPPINDRDTTSIMSKVMDPHRRPTPRNCGANISDEIEAICTKALAVDPRQRYASIAELWAAFSAAAKTRSATTMQKVVVPPPSGLNQTGNPLAATNLPPSHPSHRQSTPQIPQSPRASTPFAPPNMQTYAPPTIPQPHLPTGPMHPWVPSPPHGTAPPGGWRRMPWRQPESGWNAGSILALVAVIFIALFLGSCIAGGACLGLVGR